MDTLIGTDEEDLVLGRRSVAGYIWGCR